MEELLRSFDKSDFEKLQGLLNMFANVQNNPVVTLRVFCEEYEDYIKKNRSKAYYTSVSVSLNHLTDYFGIHNPIGTITLKDAEQFMTNLQQNAMKGYKVYYRNLKAAFNKAKKWEYINNNPFDQITLKKDQKTYPLFIDESTLNTIVKKIENETVKDVVMTAYYTGMRLNEIVNLQWRHVDLDKKMITVGDEAFTTKSRNQRYVPVCEILKIVLESRWKNCCHLWSLSRNSLSFNCERKESKNSSVVVGAIEPIKNSKEQAEVTRLRSENSGTTPRQEIEERTADSYNEMQNEYVFGKSNGDTFTGDYFSRRFKKACRAAGVDERIHFHTLRHSFASKLAQSGVSLYVIKELLGHSSITTTEIYSHLNVESLREALRIMDPPFDAPKSPSTIPQLPPSTVLRQAQEGRSGQGSGQAGPFDEAQDKLTIEFSQTSFSINQDN